jgi:DNA-binding transcriptional regulator YhcF (GntR family)
MTHTADAMRAFPQVLHESRQSQVGSLARRIADDVRAAVGTGLLGPGSKLPPVRSLAKHLGVSPNTVADAYRQLVQAGIAISRRGSGSTISDSANAIVQSTQLAVFEENLDRLLSSAGQLGIPTSDLLLRINPRLERSPV